jgi:hypothetical protein
MDAADIDTPRATSLDQETRTVDSSFSTNLHRNVLAAGAPISSRTTDVRNKMQVFGRDCFAARSVPSTRQDSGRGKGDGVTTEGESATCTHPSGDVGPTVKMQLGSLRNHPGLHSKGVNKIRSEMEQLGNGAMDPRARVPVTMHDYAPISVDGTAVGQTDMNLYAQPGAFHLVPGLPPIPARDIDIEEETGVVTRDETVPVRPKRVMVVSAVLAEHDNQPALLQHATEADPVELNASAFRRRAYFLMTLLAVVVIASTATGAIVATSHKKTTLAYRNITFEEFVATLLPADSLEQAILDSKSPQGQALEWLQHDTYGSTMVGWRMLQRYSLSAVYFSLNGNNWYNQAEWLSASEECSWSADAAMCDATGRIHFLQLSDNNLTGSIPHELSLLSDLETILMNSNSVTGTIPSEMFSLRQLKHLDVEDNLFDGTLPTEIGNGMRLERFFVAKNHLNGTIPTEVGLMTNLMFLRIFRNHFEGPLPTTLALMGKMELLAAYSNSFTGSLPTQLGRMSNLKELALQDNQLSGTLPTELGRLQRLEYAYLHQNTNIWGTIPSHLGLLVALRQLYLDSTNLSGTIPSEL